MASKKTASGKPSIRNLRVDKIFQRFPTTQGMLFGHRLESGDWLKCIGTLPPEVDEGDDLVVVGMIKQHPKFGEQFNVQFVLASGVGPLKIDENKIAQVMAMHELDRELNSGHCYEILHTVAVKVGDTLGLSYEETLERLQVPLSMVVVHGKRILKYDIDAAETTIASAIRRAIHHT